MSAKHKLETAAAVAALLLVLAFIISFAVGLRTAGTASPDLPADDVIETPPLLPAGRIEVLNASGRSGLARAATVQLRQGGFDVVFFGTAAAPRDSSVVIARSTSHAVARAAARRLDIAHVQTQIDTSLYLDATVIIGKDWPRQHD